MRASIILLLSIGLLSCGSQKSDETLIYLVRHFEKEVKVPGTKTDVGLTELGLQNALLLASHLENKNIGEVHSTDYNRTIQSAVPTSELFKLDINMYDPRDLQTFVDTLKINGVNKLVVGHSNTTGQVFGLLGCEQVSLSESDYGDIFLVRFLNKETGTPIECTRYQLTKADASMQQDLPYQLVSQAELPQYWVLDASTYSIATEKLVNPKQSGSVEVGFIIDPNGNTSNFEVLRTRPEGIWQEHALLAAKQLSFRPADTQKTYPSIYTTWTFHFSP